MLPNSEDIMTDEPVRILEIPEDKLTAEQKKVFDDLVAGRGRLLTPYKIWIHSPKVAAAMETIGTFLNKKGSLTEREVEMTSSSSRLIGRAITCRRRT